MKSLNFRLEESNVVPHEILNVLSSSTNALAIGSLMNPSVPLVVVAARIKTNPSHSDLLLFGVEV
jgi:hypothetical protein